MKFNFNDLGNNAVKNMPNDIGVMTTLTKLQSETMKMSIEINKDSWKAII